METMYDSPNTVEIVQGRREAEFQITSRSSETHKVVEREITKIEALYEHRNTSIVAIDSHGSSADQEQLTQRCPDSCETRFEEARRTNHMNTAAPTPQDSPHHETQQLQDAGPGIRLVWKERCDIN